jgi:acyl-CoA thioesterase FadM
VLKRFASALQWMTCPLTLVSHDADVTILRSGSLLILTVAATFVDGVERIAAVTVAAPNEAVARRAVAHANSFEPNIVYDAQLGRSVMIQDFDVSLRESARLDHGVYYTHILSWFSKMRELLLGSKLGREFADDVVTGKWGGVTHWAEARLTGYASSYDRVRGRLWTEKLNADSVTVSCDFCALEDSGDNAPIARASCEMSFARVLAHGHVVVEPLPAVHVPRYALLQNNERAAPALVFPAGLHSGPETWRAPSGPDGGHVLFRRVFESTREDSNLVGNLYYQVYFVWQGRLLDLLLQEIAPETVRGAGADAGEMVCVQARMTFLRDGMPFDRIQAVVRLRSLATCGASFDFGFYRLNPDASREKVSVGTQDVVWAGAAVGREIKAVAWPDRIRAELLDRAGTGQAEVIAAAASTLPLRDVRDAETDAEIHMLDAGHFALDEPAKEIAPPIDAFLSARGIGKPS